MKKACILVFLLTYIYHDAWFRKESKIFAPLTGLSLRTCKSHGARLWEKRGRCDPHHTTFSLKKCGTVKTM
jgi:hypothetical protein